MSADENRNEQVEEELKDTAEAAPEEETATEDSAEAGPESEVEALNTALLEDSKVCVVGEATIDFEEERRGAWGVVSPGESGDHLAVLVVALEHQ